jgi:purine-binding chemotaxis protein CheW
MDFLKIRRKAKERAARAADQATPPPAVEVAPPAPPPAPPVPALAVAASPAPPPPPPHFPARAPPGSAEALQLEAELSVRVAQLPHAPDARFVTWRPDGGALPELAAIGPTEGDFLSPPVEPAGPIDPLDDFFYRDDEAAPEGGLVSPAAGGEPTAPVALEEYLTFRLAGETYAVEIGRVVEVMRTPPITEVPRAPSEVQGVVSVRGEVVTVVDPRGRLGLARAEGPPAKRLVIVDDGSGSCGLLVDRVAGVVRLPRGALEPCPQALVNAGGDLFIGIGRDRDRLFLVIDAAALLRPLRRAAEARPG